MNNPNQRDNTAPLLVVHVISGLGQGGAETVLHRLATAPTQRNRHIVISMTDEGVFGPRLRAQGVGVYTLNMASGRLSAGGLWRLFRLLRDLSPDVVQTWMYHADLIGGVLARLAGNRAVAWGIRNSGANLQQGSRTARALAWVCARLSGFVPQVIIACADDARDRHALWGYRGDRMLVIPNGYDLSKWVIDRQARQRLRQEWGVEETTPVVGHVGRWNALKDHANLLAAVALCVKTRPDLKCMMAGSGLDTGNRDLMALIDQHGLREHVVLLGMRDDIPAFMNAIDLHVLSSMAEGFPNVVAEAMAAGVPVVVTDVGDAAKIAGDAGWVVPPRNAPALAQAITQAVNALGTPEMAERVRQGRDRVGRLFSLETMVAAYETAWRRLAQDFPSRRARMHAPLYQRGVHDVDTTAGAAPSDVNPVADATVSSVPHAGARRSRLLYVVNNPAFFLSHRLPLALAAQHEGFEVHVATMNGPSVPEIERHGLRHHVIPMSRSGKNPIEELQTTVALWKLFRGLRPDIVHAVTIKPVLYGGIAARLAGVPAYIAAVSGLGFVFMRERNGVDFLRLAATALYRLALGHSHSRVIFQNQSDLDVLRRAGVVRSDQAVIIRGSGVDLDEFAVRPEPEGVPIALMVSRLLADKGVREFIDAARLSAQQGANVRWMLAGSPDSGNPASVTPTELAQWKREGHVEFLGERNDIAALYQQSHIAVLPSYREGMPKSLLEAAACGRAVVTTDVPGCRDAIEPGVTGILVPVCNATALANAVQRLAADAALRQEMGAAGRALAEREFDVRHIIDAHLMLYRAGLQGGRPA